MPRPLSVKRLRRLARHRKDRSQEGAFVIEGPTLLDEALRCDLRVEAVFAEPDADPALLERARQAGAVVHALRDGVLATATDTVTPQSVATIAAMSDVTLEQALAEAPLEAALVLAGLADPGNLGTLMRSADAVGADLVVCCDDTVDPYGPKSVRASAGALFRLRVVRRASASDAIAALQAHGVLCLGMVARDGVPYDHVDLTHPWAFVLANEAHGLAEAIRRLCDELVSIPMRGPTESLNVAMAGTVVCFEAFRQRRS